MKPDELNQPSLETSSEAFLERFLPGTSPSIIQLRERVMQLNSPRNSGLVNVVLILGESGAGKNHLARVLAAHRRFLEVRNSKIENPGLESGLDPFTGFFEEIHLPALPDTLIESELFGYKRGAFTGAEKDTPGLLGGSGKLKSAKDYKDLLLDEIGDSSAAVQAKLLQVVERGRFRPVGGGPDDYFPGWRQKDRITKMPRPKPT